jgi:hypothetical protein
MQNPNPHFSKAHVTNFNFNKFKVIEAMGLKLLHRGPLEWHYFLNKFHDNLLSGSEIISGRHRQTDW